MSLTQRARDAGILRRAVAIVLDTAVATTHQMHSMEGMLRADLRPPKRKRR